MKSIFKSPFKVTQFFGVNKEYYSQFGLAGHEGLDLIPQDLSDWTIISPEANGQVVKDIDNPKDGGAYGNTATIWYPSKKIALQFCHMEKNEVKVGDKVSKGQIIGKMGSTGNTNGAHVHLNLFQVDDNGVRLNRNNGYLGGIDPLPYLSEGENEGTFVERDTFDKLVHNSTQWDEIVNEYKAGSDPRYTQFEDVKKVISGYKSEVTTAQNAKTETDKKLALAEQEVTNQKEKLANKEREYQQDVILLKAQIEALKKVNPAEASYRGELESTIGVLRGSLREEQKQHGLTKLKLTECQIGKPQTTSFLDFITNLFKKK